MIFHSKQKVNGAPAWEVDTDTQTVRHRNPKTGEEIQIGARRSPMFKPGKALKEAVEG